MKLLLTFVLFGSLTAHADRPIPATPEELTKTVQEAFEICQPENPLENLDD